MIKKASSLCAVVLLAGIVLPLPLFAQQFSGPYRMSAGSMKPTLLSGDNVIAFKYTESSGPKQGDIVVFHLPKDNLISLKRLIGLPGDRIQMINGLLHINGQPVKRERIDDYVEEDGGRTLRIKRWRETLPNSVSHETLDMIDNGFYDNTQVYTVPLGHYFVMGDNRDHSTDSRVLSQFGYIPSANIIGRGERR